MLNRNYEIEDPGEDKKEEHFKHDDAKREIMQKGLVIHPNKMYKSTKC